MATSWADPTSSPSAGGASSSGGAASAYSVPFSAGAAAPVTAGAVGVEADSGAAVLQAAARRENISHAIKTAI